MVVAGVYHFSLYRIVNRFEEAVRPLLADPTAPQKHRALFEKDEVRRLFKPISTLYAHSKLIVAVFMLNAITWSSQGVEQKWVFTATVLALFVLGVGVFSFPRYHIQYLIYKLWQVDGREEYIDIRTPVSKGIGAVSNSIILGTTAITLLLNVLPGAVVEGSFFYWLAEIISKIRVFMFGR
jgi:hypothetical protein